MKKHEWYKCIWELEFRNKEGALLHKIVKENALVNEGEQNILNSFFRSLGSPTQFYMRLCNDTLDIGDTLPTITGEPDASFGYAPQLIEKSEVGFPTIELYDGHYRTISKQVTFTASGGAIGPVNTGYLATTLDNSGLLISFVNFDVPRTIIDGSSLLAKFQITLI